MASSCYLCEVLHQTIPGQNITDALGVCSVCSILCCHAHAQRDPNYPRWICVLCDTNLLTMSALHNRNATLRMTDTFQLEIFESIEEFLRKRPNYKRNEPKITLQGVEDELLLLKSAFRSDVTEPLWYSLSIKEKKLLMAAILIVKKYKLQKDDLHRVLYRFVLEGERFGNEL